MPVSSVCCGHSYGLTNGGSFSLLDWQALSRGSMDIAASKNSRKLSTPDSPPTASILPRLEREAKRTGGSKIVETPPPLDDGPRQRLAFIR